MSSSKSPYGKQRPYGSLKALVLLNVKKGKTVSQISELLEATPHVVTTALNRMIGQELPKDFIIPR